MKKQGKKLPPPWMLGAKDIHGVPMIVVHMQAGELEGLDNLQGGPTVDPMTGIREYSALSEIIEIPEVQEMFHTVASQLQEHGKVSPGVHQAYESAKHHSLPYRETKEEEKDPLDALEKRAGRGKDKKFALVPVNLVEFLMEIHHPSINPKTGLLEFGFFRELLRVVGTVGGALLGGPIGAGVGNAVARVATGNKVKDALVGGLKTGAIGYGAQALGQVAGLGGKALGGFFGGAPNMLARGLGSMGAAVPGSTSAAGATAAGATAAAPAASGMLSNVGGLLSNLAMPAAMMGLAYKGSKDNYKHEKAHRDRLEAKYDKEREEQGWNTDWTPVTAKRREPNPEFYNVSEDDIKHGRSGDYAFRDAYAKGGLVQSYSKGTLVKGKGKGQDDLIKTSVPDGAYIIDASSTSDFGDGSSSAGAAVLSKFESHIKNKFPNKLKNVVQKEVSKRSKQVPVWLSNDEFKFDPVTVTLLGNGSNKRGADTLRRMVKELRKHKSSNGNELPPKAKNPLDYIRRRS